MQKLKFVKIANIIKLLQTKEKNVFTFIQVQNVKLDIKVHRYFK